MTTDQKIALMNALAMRMAGQNAHLLGMDRLATMAAEFDAILANIKREPVSEIPLEEALQVVCQHINNAPDYREGWVSNIAVAFQQAVGGYAEMSNALANRPGRIEQNYAIIIHELSNKAANSFIDLLIRDLTKPDNDDFKI